MSLYQILNEAHSGWRYLVLLLGIAAVVDFAIGWMSKKKYSKLDDRISLFYTISLDIQLLIGLLLYFFFSPVVKGWLSGQSDFSDDNTRLYALEHPLIMLLAIVLAHVGRSLSKRGDNDAAKFRKGTIYFTLSLMLIVSRMPW